MLPKRLWVHIPKNAKDRLEVLINNEQGMVGKYGEYFLDVKNIEKISKDYQRVIFGF